MALFKLKVGSQFVERICKITTDKSIWMAFMSRFPLLVDETNKYDVSDKVAFVTGAAKGLGRVFAEALLESGAKVYFCDDDASAGVDTFEEFKKRFSKKRVRFFPLDVTDHQQFRETFIAAAGTFGHIDLMVNNAEITDESKWLQMININFTSVVFGTFMAMEHMRKDNVGLGGRIINIISMSGVNDNYMFPVYSGAKHGVRAFTTSLSKQPTADEMGLEFGVLCSEFNATHNLFELDKYMRSSGEGIGQRSIFTSRTAEAFMSLVQLEKMNGSVLLVSDEGHSFYRAQTRSH